MLRGYFRYHRFEIREDMKEHMVATHGGLEIVRATFDELGRLTDLIAA